MATNSFRVKSGTINVTSGSTGTESGDITVNSNKVEFYNGTTSSPIVTESHSATLTNKTLTTPTINGAALSGTFSGTPTFSGAVAMSSTLAVTGVSTLTGNVGVGAASASNVGLFIRSSLNAVSPAGIDVNPTIGASAVSAFGIYTQIVLGSGAAPTNAYGIYLDGFTGAGTATNKYGFYQNDSNPNVFTGATTFSSTVTATGILSTSVNAGVGTSSPSSSNVLRFLHVANATSAGIVMENTTATAQKYSIYVGSTKDLRFIDETAGTAPLVISQTSGNATFAGTVTASTTGNSNISIRSSGNGSSKWLDFVNTNGAPNSKSWMIGADYGGVGQFEITPSTASGGTTYSTPALTINSSSNATFAGQVKTTVGSVGVLLQPTTGTAYNAIQFTNTGGTGYVGTEGSAGGTLIVGSSAYDMSIAAPGGRNLLLGYNGGTGIGLKLDINGNTTVTGALSTSMGTDDSSTSTPRNTLTVNGSFMRMTGSAAITINGIAAGTSGQRLTLYNGTNNALTLTHNSGSATGAKIIISGALATVSISSLGIAEFIYDATTAVWRLIKN